MCWKNYSGRMFEFYVCVMQIRELEPSCLHPAVSVVSRKLVLAFYSRPYYGESFRHLNLKKVDKILWCHHSNETSQSELVHIATFLEDFGKRTWLFCIIFFFTLSSSGVKGSRVVQLTINLSVVTERLLCNFFSVNFLSNNYG